MNPLHTLDAVALIDAFRTGQASPCDALAAIHERIQRLQPEINAFCFQNESVLEDAKASEQRWARQEPLGPLDGVPVIIKDNLMVKGMPASWGNAELATRVAEHDELPVERLRQAGALIPGKANVPEFTVEGYTANATSGVSTNPFDTRLTPGGSSGAVAAAVASGQATLGLGTDGGGSIRRPAAYCGLVGLKPGLGHIPRARGLPQLLLDFEVVGPLTRSVRDARLMDAVLRGSSRLDPVSRLVYRENSHYPCPEQSQRILYVPRFGNAPCDPELVPAARHFADRLADMGHQVSEGILPLDLEPMTAHWRTIAEIGLSQLFKADQRVAESASPLYQAMAERGDTARVDQLWQVMNYVRDLRRQASELFAEWDLILTPATAAMPWPAADASPAFIDGQSVEPRGHAVYSGWVNAIGHPSIAMPSMASAKGLPIGVQLVGDLGTEHALLDLAEAIEGRYGGFQWPEDAADPAPSLTVK